jgi:cytochrome c oxidase subunit 3
MLNLNRSNFQAHPFHLVSPSPWPLYTSVSLLSLTTSAVLSFHGFANTEYNLMLSLTALILYMSFWWRDVIEEDEDIYISHHTLAIQRGLNLGVGLFIVSEALLFLVISWTFFHSALSPAVELGAMWPPMGIEAIDPFELPLINTVILLSSGFTVTYGHHFLINGKRSKALYGFLYTVILATIFTGLQGVEYSVSTFTISDGAFGICYWFGLGLITTYGYSLKSYYNTFTLVGLVLLMVRVYYVYTLRTLYYYVKFITNNNYIKIINRIFELKFWVSIISFMTQIINVSLVINYFSKFICFDKILSVNPHSFSSLILQSSGWKGKGKAIDTSMEDSPKSPDMSDTDSENDLEYRRALANSLLNKVGESSKTYSKSVGTKENSDNDLEYKKALVLSLQEKLDKSSKTSSKSASTNENSPVQYDLFKVLSEYTQDWKTYSENFSKNAKLFNELKINLDKKPVKTKEELSLLSEYRNKAEEFKLKRDIVENKLIQQGINPSEQFSPTNSEYSSTGSSYSSSNSEDRRKRLKYSSDNDSHFSLGIFVFNTIPSVPIISYIISAILFLLIGLDILPYFGIRLNLNLTELLFLCTIFNFSKLILRGYKTTIIIYNSYLNKDYMTIYFNLYFSIIIILLYLSNNIDIGIFYC